MSQGPLTCRNDFHGGGTFSTHGIPLVALPSFPRGFMPPKDEVLQSGFGVLVAQTARQWRRAVDRQLAPFGLTEATWLPLLHVSRAPSRMRQKELAASLSLDGSSVVRLLDALEALDLIRRQEEGDDRRAKTIVLTGFGRSTAVSVERSVRKVRQEALGGLHDAELAAAHGVLMDICEALALWEKRHETL